MALSLKHKFTSGKSDGTDLTLIQPSNWNDTHSLTLSAGKIIGRPSGSDGDASELPLAFDASLQSYIGPKGTTSQRPSSVSTAMQRFNTDFNMLEVNNGTNWVTLADDTRFQRASDVAIAATLVKPTTLRPGSFSYLTGSGTVTALWAGETDGTCYEFKVVTSVTFTNSATLACPNGNDLSLVANSYVRFRYESTGTVWRVVGGMNADGTSIGGGAGKLLVRRFFTNSVTPQTYLKNSAATFIIVYVLGAGSAGSGSARLGGTVSNPTGMPGFGGGCAIKLILNSSLTIAGDTVTVGKGGVAAAPGNNPGPAGGTSSFGSFCSATGGDATPALSTSGNGALWTTVAAAPQGGIGTGGDINLRGSPGDTPIAHYNKPSITLAGGRGAGPFGQPGAQRITLTFGTDGSGLPASDANGGGGGGAGLAHVTSCAGGNGADGIVVIEEYA